MGYSLSAGDSIGTIGSPGCSAHIRARKADMALVLDLAFCARPCSPRGQCVVPRPASVGPAESLLGRWPSQGGRGLCMVPPSDR